MRGVFVVAGVLTFSGLAVDRTKDKETREFIDLSTSHLTSLGVSLHL